MSVRSARQKAERLTKMFNTGSPPIDVEAIIERLGVSLIYDDLGAPEISGLLISNEDGACIIIQKYDHPNRQRFSIGHEIGHFALGHQFEDGEHVHVDRGNYISWRDPRTSSGLDPKEIEANAFAASLLMPNKLIRLRADEVRKGGPLLDHQVLQLAEEFAVSEQAMTIRLTALDLL